MTYRIMQDRSSLGSWDTAEKALIGYFKMFPELLDPPQDIYLVASHEGKHVKFVSGKEMIDYLNLEAVLDEYYELSEELGV